jgi:hypothetical protein
MKSARVSALLEVATLTYPEKPVDEVSLVCNVIRQTPKTPEIRPALGRLSEEGADGHEKEHQAI